MRGCRMAQMIWFLGCLLKNEVSLEQARHNLSNVTGLKGCVVRQQAHSIRHQREYEYRSFQSSGTLATK
jgi:hypothetical protein